MCDDAFCKAGRCFSFFDSSSSSLQTNVLTISCVCTHQLRLHRSYNFGALCVVLIGLGVFQTGFRITFYGNSWLFFFFLRSQLSRSKLPQWSSTPTTDSLRCFYFTKLNSLLDFIVSVWTENWIFFFLCCASTVDAHAAVMENVHKWHYGFINIQSFRSRCRF